MELNDGDGQSRTLNDDKNNVSVQEAVKCIQAAVEEFRGQAEEADLLGSLYAFQQPSDALRCALAVQERLPKLKTRIPIEARIGIHSDYEEIPLFTSIKFQC